SKITITSHKTGTTQSGFVQTAITAYNKHHHLIIRPDDLWISVISQFALFLGNRDHAESLRQYFTSRPGGKDLVHVECDTLADMATAFRKELKQRVLDQEFVPWIVPEFTTTTEQDREVASFLMLGALKNFFEYSCALACGLPSVTLLGEKKDYEEILRRIDYLDKFGNEDLTTWAKQLRAVLSKAFIAAFDMADDEKKKTEVVDAWGKICHYENGGSGPDYVSGWICAFTYFGQNG
ncbi:hypothetical protein BJ508DRAFT_200378, partial [Ascobolus immersus RN42]